MAKAERDRHASGSRTARKGQAMDRLRLVFWETTAGCNLECVHCRRLDVSHQMMQDDLSTSESFRLVDQLSDMGRDIILVLSGGEPLLRPDIFDIAHHAHHRGLTLALATNGTLVDETTAQEIRRAGIRRVSVSLDGADAKTHDGFRMIEGSFEAALRGINHLGAVGVEVQINSTIAMHNVHQVGELYQLARTLGAVAFHLFMLVPVGCGVQLADNQMLRPEIYEEILNWLYDISVKGPLLVKATCAPHYFRIAYQRAGRDGMRSSPAAGSMNAVTKGCLAGSAVCFVSHKGEVFPCGYLPVEAGNIRTRSFRDIWENSEVFRLLRDVGNLQGKCGACEYRKVCMGCRARAYAGTGNFLAEEPYCSYRPRQGTRDRQLIKIH